MGCATPRFTAFSLATRPPGRYPARRASGRRRVRGKDCVHLNRSFATQRLDELFSARARGHRAHGAPLHDVAAWAVGDEGVAFSAVLLNAGARLDVRDDLLESTPLGWACRWGRAELVRLLLDRGADPVEADAEPWATPLAWATRKGHDAIVALLHEARGT